MPVITENKAVLSGAVAFAHLVLAATIEPGDTVVDGTVGNGRDALFLAERVGRGGVVHCFDIQPEALKSARALIADHDVAATVRFYKQSHDGMADVLLPRCREKVRAVMFNLGYLPGGDKSVVTRSETTLPALKQALDFLMPGGILSVVIYSAHPGGAEEAGRVEAWARALDKSQYHVSRLEVMNRLDAPALVLVRKQRPMTSAE